MRQALLDQIEAEPTNAKAHRESGDYYVQCGALVSAIAQYRTALAFEKNETTLFSLVEAYRKAGYNDLARMTEASLSAALGASTASPLSHDQSPLQALDATRYQRLQTVSRRIKELYNSQPRVLDVGGADGVLCLFLPEAEYVLAEPMTNGLSATDLPDNSFDVVIACHVLEHIRKEMRDEVLLQLCRKSRGRVLLLQPFAVTGIESQVDQLVYDITKLEWAAEHLTCELPTLTYVEEFCKRNQLSITVTPNSARAAVYWMVFASHFAGAAGKVVDLDRVTRFFNAHYAEQMTNPLQPNDYLIEFASPIISGVSSESPGDPSEDLGGHHGSGIL